jgi:hypothetical protein
METSIFVTDLAQQFSLSVADLLGPPRHGVGYSYCVPSLGADRPDMVSGIRISR